MRDLGVVSETFWADVAARCDYATFFHTPRWGTIVAAAGLPFEPRPWGFALADGHRAVVPAFVWRRWLGGLGLEYALSAAGVYGGPIASRSLTSQEARELIRRLLGPRTASLTVWENPYAPFTLAPGPAGDPTFTHILDLAPGFDRVVRGFNRGCQSAVNKALRLGVRVRSSDGPKDWEVYHEVYESTLRRWGATTSRLYPRALFQALSSLSERDERCRLWLAELDGTVVAGAVVLYWSRMAIYWHGAALDSSFFARPNNLLHREIIRDACAKGLRWYDFNPSGGFEGVVRFKDSFGATRRQVGVYRWGNTLFRPYFVLRNAIRSWAGEAPPALDRGSLQERGISTLHPRTGHRAGSGLRS